jgi:hypothetical protein
VPPTLAGGFYPYSQRSVAARTAVFIARIDSDDPMSHTISAVWQCVQGKDASNEGFLRSLGQLQARGLVP